MKYTKGQQLMKRVEKLEGKVKRTKITPMPLLREKVQTIVNAYVRERDAELGCISCGTKNGTFHGGHFIHKKAYGALRYDLRNINKQCFRCNHMLRGNLLEYRISLIKKIGLQAVEELENRRHEEHKWTREELEEIKSLIKEKRV